MKQKIKLVMNGNVIKSTTIKLRDKDHFNIQLKNKSKVFRDRTKYTRKRKHKNLDY